MAKFFQFFSKIYIEVLTLMQGGLDQNNNLIADNSAKLYEAQNHAAGLELQVPNFQRCNLFH